MRTHSANCAPSAARHRANQGSAPSAHRAHPHPRAGGRGDGERTAGSGRREARYCHPTRAPGRYRPARLAPRACRLRVPYLCGRPATLVDAGALRAPRFPSARRRSRRRTAGRGRWNSRPASGCARRVTAPNTAGHQEGTARRTRAKGAQAARQHPGEVAARRRPWMRRAGKLHAIRQPAPPQIMDAAPSRIAYPHSARAVAATARGGRREASNATQRGHPGV